MKKLLSLLFILPLFMACSSDDDKDEKPTVKTTFNIKTDKTFYLGGVAASLNSNGKFIKIANVSLLNNSQDEILNINSDTITRLYIFSDNDLPIDPFTKRPLKNRIDTVFIIKKGTHNEFLISKNTKAIVVFGDDDTQYPK